MYETSNNISEVSKRLVAFATAADKAVIEEYAIDKTDLGHVNANVERDGGVDTSDDESKYSLPE
ncbi:hypothetical protein H1R20_g7474, partial [Candolleomyces eurysporus]